MPEAREVTEPMTSPIAGSKPYSAVQTGASMTPSRLMNSWTWISPMAHTLGGVVLDLGMPGMSDGSDIDSEVCMSPERKRPGLSGPWVVVLVLLAPAVVLPLLPGIYA